jgi:hypothetical protein
MGIMCIGNINLKKSGKKAIKPLVSSQFWEGVKYSRMEIL